MKPEPSPERLERYRRIKRRRLLILSLLLSAAGYVVLAVSPEFPMDVVITRAFIGMGLLLGGFFVGLFSRIVS
jgi:predicted MFS family arabinose efflux permease